MLKPALKGTTKGTRVEVLTLDAAFDQSVRETFGVGGKINVEIVSAPLAERGDALGGEGVTVVVIDLDAANRRELAALERLAERLAGWPPLVVVTPSFDTELARRLVQMRVADILVKPVPPAELVRSCVRVTQAKKGADRAEAEIYTFVPAVGGAGVTTIAIQTALILLGSGDNKARPATCLVDLDFQNGACTHHLDLEPRLDLAEIEPRPERLDRQLLESMLSYHSSGLAVIAAPNRPAEMRTFDPDIVTRLLDLVSAQFRYVVIDMPRTWFPWTDSVLLGSNRLYIVCEMTVPGFSHARQLVTAVRERLGEGPRPQVIVNRFEQRLFGPGLRRRDAEQAFGSDLAATVPNNYRLVREAIDRGVPLEEVRPGNQITRELKKLILPVARTTGTPESAGAARKRLAMIPAP
jgi:pilus assembly protein CpaE